MTVSDKQDNQILPITRSLVLDHLYELEEDYNSKQSFASDSQSGSPSANATVDVSELCDSRVDPLSPSATFGDALAWLDNQCKLEQARIDWSPEYIRPFENRGQCEGLNTAVLGRIRRGYGPRSSDFEDLLWPLRLGNPEENPKFSKRPRTESSKDMEQALLSWNDHVASAYDDPKARISFVDAMYQRVAFLDRIISHRRSADAHDDTSRKLLHAIYAYRPETSSFETNDTCTLLTIILAHIGFAIPDIDQELKHLIFTTLVAERNYMAHTANAATRNHLETKIAKAKRLNDTAMLSTYERKLSDWTHNIIKHNSSIITSRIKTARRNIELRALADLQTLTILQTAQKIVLQDRLSHNLPPSTSLAPRSTWLPSHAAACSLASSHLSHLAHTYFSPDIFASTALAAQHTATMRSIVRARILTRALKFAGLDLKNVSEAERQRVVRERMAHPGTVRMMEDAVAGMEEVKGKSGKVVDALGVMGERLGEMLREVREVRGRHEELARRVEGEVGLGSG